MFANLKIGTRLTLGFGIVLGLLCLMASVAAWQIGKLADISIAYAEDLVPSFQIEHDISLALADVRRHEFRHVLSDSAADMDDVEAKIRAYQQKAIAKLDEYEKGLTSHEDDKRALDATRQAVMAYFAEWDKVRALSRQKHQDPAKFQEAAQQIKGPSSKAYTAANDAIVKMWEINVGLSNQQKADAQSTHTKANITLALIVIAALGLGIGAAVLITRSIVVPIQQAVQVASTVAEGDLTARIDVRGADETAQLLQALKHMNEGLVAVVSKVRQSSDSIATGSTQIAAGTVDLSQRTEEQASNLEETAASMEQLTSTVKTNAETAHQASELADAAAKAAANGGAVVQQVIETMDGISQSSKKIADIIGVIDGIAFQTNILALNAAVEAARAGEQGRGFAVVASEVRALAQRSADAAKDITAKIGSSSREVEDGVKLVRAAGEALERIKAELVALRADCHHSVVRSDDG